MRVTFGSYGKTPRTRTIRGAAPCGSWFAHSPAKHFAGGRTAGVGAGGLRVGPGAGREPVRAHGVEDSRWLFEEHDHRNCADARRLSLAGHGIRLAPLRWRPRCSVATASGCATPQHNHPRPARLPRWDALDWHDERARELDGR